MKSHEIQLSGDTINLHSWWFLYFNLLKSIEKRL